MDIFRPDKKLFKKNYDSGKPQLLYSILSADLNTPVSVLLKFKKEKYSFLLESVEKGSNKGRYSVLGIKPDLIWKCKDKECQIEQTINKKKSTHIEKNLTPIESLKLLFKKNKFKIPENLPPMSSGLFGYLGYDMIKYFENINLNNKDDLNLPESIFIRPTIMVIFDNVSDKLFIINTVWPNSDNSEKAFLDSLNQVKKILVLISKPLNLFANKHEKIDYSSKTLLKKVSSNTEFKQFQKMITQAKKYIFSGDIFQVVL